MIYICTQKSVLINVLLNTTFMDDINERLKHSPCYPGTPMSAKFTELKLSLKQKNTT